MMFVVLVQTPHTMRVEVFGPFPTKEVANHFVATLEAMDYQRGDHLYTVNRIRSSTEVL